MAAGGKVAVGKKSSRVKIISMGNPETGKSCIIKRYCEKRFVTKYLATIGIDFGVTKVTVDDWQLKVNIFDLSGHPLFYEVRTEFYKDTQAALLVYDISERDSFDSLDYWMHEMRKHVPKDQQEKLVIALCANKVDKKSRVVTLVEGKLWAEQNSCYYFETSAQSGDGVQEMFQMLFKSLVQVLETGSRPQEIVSSLGFTKEQSDVISKLEKSRDNYERLGLTQKTCTRDEVNRVYKKYAMLIHPDKCTAPGTEDAFKILGTARSDLLYILKN